MTDKEVVVMTDSHIDVFGPGFVPGKVSVARDVASRAMSRTYTRQAAVDASAGKQPASDLDAPEQSAESSES